MTSTCFSILGFSSDIFVNGFSPDKFTEVVMNGTPDSWISSVNSESGILTPMVSVLEMWDKKSGFFFFRISVYGPGRYLFRSTLSVMQFSFIHSTDGAMIERGLFSSRPFISFILLTASLSRALHPIP